MSESTEPVRDPGRHDAGEQGGSSTDHDPAGPAVPPSNPPRDDDAVERSEDELHRVTGH